MSIKHTLTEIANKTKEVFKTPSLVGAILEFSDKNIIINTTWSQVDIEKNDSTRYQKTYLFELDNQKNDKLARLVHTSTPFPIRTNVWSVKSPDNNLNAIVTNWKDNNEEKQFLEIWENDVRISNINLTKLDNHSKIYENSSCLGSFVWSSDSSKLAYVAEVKKENNVKCLITANLNKDPESSEKSSKDLIDENNYDKKYANEYKDEWGEQYVGKGQSVITIYDLKTNQFKVVDSVPEGFTPAQITWCGNEGLVFNAYYTKPYRLGLVFCPIRESNLFYYDINNNETVQITDYKNESLRNPVFSNDFENLCWLQNQAKGPHFQASKLVMMNWKSKEVTVIIDIVRNNKGEEFPGLFTIKLPNNCWSLDNKRILFETQFKRTNRIGVVDVETKKVTILNNELGSLTSCHTLRIKDDWICAVIQSYNRRQSMILGKLPSRGNEANINWIFPQIKEDNLVGLANVHLLDFKPKTPDTTYPNLDFEAILVEAKEKNDALVVFPHGGPHSSYCCEFLTHVAVFYSLGYSVLLINYRGSSGYGQDTIESLPKNIGTYDVQDCQQAAEYCMNKYNFKHAVLYGGSHGGFLTTHLIGQYPEFYKAASARNPVTHLESMLYLTDIPDWVIVEGLGVNEFDFKMDYGHSIYKDLFERSPMRYINDVKTPLLLAIGCVDLRVPPSQGVEFYKGLLARNVPTKLLKFKEDCHSLDKPQTTSDCIIHTILWYEKYMS